jgi:hypothetical protein
MPEITCILLLWLGSGLFILGWVLSAGCLLACLYLSIQKAWSDLWRMLGCLLAAVALILACKLGYERIIVDYYGYTKDETAMYIGFLFPGLASLFFFPEPLKRAKQRLRQYRARFGAVPQVEVEQKPSKRVTSLPTRRR